MIYVCFDCAAMERILISIFVFVLIENLAKSEINRTESYDRVTQGLGIENNLSNSKNYPNSDRAEQESKDDEETCVCGVAKPKFIESSSSLISPTNRIVNGYQPEDARPWMALLEIGIFRSQCGGSLINHLYVLSAAHCFCFENHPYSKLCRSADHEVSKEDKITVFLGVIDIQAEEKLEYGASKLHIHPERIEHELKHRLANGSKEGPDYDPYAGPYDIALVKLNKHVDFIPGKIGPICLFGIDVEQFTFGFVAGYGSQSFSDKCWTSKDGPNAFEECKRTFEYRGKTYENQCVKDENPPGPDQVCKKLYHFVGQKVSERVDKIFIEDSTSDVKERNFCPVVRDVDDDGDDGGQDFGWCEIENPKGYEKSLGIHWGFCSHHCSEKPKRRFLMETKLKIMAEEKCVRLNADAVDLDSSHEFCAAKFHREPLVYAIFKRKSKTKFRLIRVSRKHVEYYGGTDACQGDSGGPLWVWTQPTKSGLAEVTNRSQRIVQAFQIGIISRGNGCAFRNQPGAYTAVEHFRNFIKSKIEGGGCLKYKLPSENE